MLSVSTGLVRVTDPVPSVLSLALELGIGRWESVPALLRRTTMDYKGMSTADLVVELARLRALRCWRQVTVIEHVLHGRQPVELAQDAYYYGTAADLRAIR
jgi:hypothetical protein